MRLNHLIILAAVASVLTYPAEASNHVRAAAPSAPASAAKMCRVFDSAYWDNQGFVVACDKQAQDANPPTRRCPMFNSSAYDTVGFTVSCEREAVAASMSQRTCPVFTPATWDNMGFRVPC